MSMNMLGRLSENISMPRTFFQWADVITFATENGEKETQKF